MISSVDNPYSGLNKNGIEDNFKKIKINVVLSTSYSGDEVE